MSAFVVNKATIDVLVAGLVQYRVISPDVAEATGALLWAENHASVNYRYSENEPTPFYSAEVPTDRLHPVAIASALDCYDYQSCEHPEWKDSDARALLICLITSIFVAHPELGQQLPCTDRDRRGQTEPAIERHAAQRVIPPGDFADLRQAYWSTIDTEMAS